jgi:aminoglycoside phosphotransferase (APT) family kinase protein
MTLPEKEQIGVLTELAVGLKELHSHRADSFNFDWHKFVEHQANIAVERQIAARVNPEWVEKLPEFIKTNLKLLPKNSPTVFLHGDVHFGNLRLQKVNGEWQISGLFDFADSLCGFHEFDFLAIGLLMIQGQGKLQRKFFRAYGYAENELDESLRKRLMLLTVLYECSDLRRYALRLAPEAVNFSFEKLEQGIWSFADKF